MSKILQRDVFLKSEADAWFSRNEKAISDVANKNDIIVDEISNIGLLPQNILEIGCSNGWRLQMLKEKYGCNCSGVEPSSAAIDVGRKNFPEIDLNVGTADLLKYDDESFDLVIFGFCLYLCDRNELFKIAAEADRVLKDSGHIMILDFSPTTPYRNKYSHADGVYSYKMDYSKMFSWSPAYTNLVNKIMPHPGANDISKIDDRVGVSVLQKNTKIAYPDSVFG